MPSSLQLQALLDAAVDGIIVIDHRGSIEVFNRAAERLFRYAAEEVLGRNVSVLMTDSDRANHDAHIQRYLTTRQAHVIGIGREVQARRKDGSVFPAFLSIGVSPNSGQPHFVGFIHDITDRRQAEDSARQIQERMTHISRLATLGEMATGIAHELNQPLSAITTYAHAGQRMLTAPEPDLADLGEALEQIAAQGLRAGEIIRRLRSLVRERPTVHEVANINEVIYEFRAFTRRVDTRLNEIELRLELTPQPLLVSIDRAQIQHVLLNLILNAIDALQDVSPEDRSILIATSDLSARDVEVAVCDSGPGVTPAIMGRLFHPFCTTKPTGTGLGLAVSRTIVKAHDGELNYRPNVPAGACFAFQLPRVDSIPRP